MAEARQVAGGRVLAIGNFDGVHLGHRKVISAAVAEARALGAQAVALTFDPHPMAVLRPDLAKEMLTCFEQKAAQFARLGVDMTVCLPFDLHFAEQTPAQFAERVLVPLQTRTIFVGANYKFGKGRSGHVDTLVTLGQTHGFEVHPQSFFTIDGQRVSSSRIRAALRAGDVAEAGALLSRPYSISGPVVEGSARGRELGYRTANLEIPAVMVPTNGVYAARVELPPETDTDGTAAPLEAIVYIGTRPTFEDGSRFIEVHLLGEKRDLYGQTIQVHFVDRVRSEMTFNSADALTSQIAEDVHRAEQMLSR